MIRSSNQISPGKKNPRVDRFLGKAVKWRNEFEALREIILEFPLAEEVKWGVPCYTLGDKNIVLIHGFKEYCAILFFKGALLKDSKDILIRQTENVQASRQVRFTGVNEIIELGPVLRAYIKEAIDVEKEGLKVDFKKPADFNIPDEFQDRLHDVPGLKSAFDALTPGRQRAYILYFSSARQSRTRESRIAKYMPYILKGKGLNDR